MFYTISFTISTCIKEHSLYMHMAGVYKQILDLIRS